jgi:hypothetical protein
VGAAETDSLSHDDVKSRSAAAQCGIRVNTTVRSSATRAGNERVGGFFRKADERVRRCDVHAAGVLWSHHTSCIKDHEVLNIRLGESGQGHGAHANMTSARARRAVFLRTFYLVLHWAGPLGPPR